MLTFNAFQFISHSVTGVTLFIFWLIILEYRFSYADYFLILKKYLTFISYFSPMDILTLIVFGGGGYLQNATHNLDKSARVCTMITPL